MGEVGLSSTTIHTATVPDAGAAAPAGIDVAATMHGRREPAGESIPIRAHIPVAVNAAERAQLARLADALRRRDPAISSIDAFGPRTSVGLPAAAPTLVLHDLASVGAGPSTLRDPLEYRGFMLAGAGDIVPLSAAYVPAFEAYVRDVLGLGGPEVVRLVSSAAQRSLATRILRDPAALSRIVDLAADRGGLNVLPYQGTGAAWSLAGAIGDRADVPVSVGAPPPTLTRRVNDKLWFARRVADVLGERALPPSAQAHGLAVLAGRVRALAREHDRIAIKLPSASAAAGNIVIHAEPLRGLSLTALRDVLGRVLTALGWRRAFPVLVSVWESPVLTSPSIQLWIPRLGAGAPLVEGVFEQRVSPEIGEFMGAAPSGLPARWQIRMAHEAVRLATLFQELGYYGRCSMDAILVGPSLDDAELHWVETNGRWGGTSIPMTLVNRLAGDWTRHSFVVSRVPYVGPDGGPPFAELLDRTAGRLFRPGEDAGGLVYLTPTLPRAARGIDVMVIASDPAAAWRELAEVTRELIGGASATTASPA